jgi:ketosteroid isomerase-like protein
MIKHALLVMTFLVAGAMVVGQPGEENDITASIESLKKAMLTVDTAALNQLTAEKLSYGHSSGLVEDKKEFIRKMTSKENVYTNIIISEQGITMSGDVAIVRNLQEVFVNNEGKPAQLKLIVMMVWQKQDKQWKLLARQAVRKPEPK